MVTSAIKQFMNDVEWGELDYMILDLPPGTGDIQLTIVQSVSLSGAVIVSTPQNVALDDVRKGVAMFHKVNVPVLGVIENMAYFSPPDAPDKKYYIFGQGGASQLADELAVPVLGEIPLEQPIRESGDNGKPIVLADQESAAAASFLACSANMQQQLAIRAAPTPKDLSICLRENPHLLIHNTDFINRVYKSSCTEIFELILFANTHDLLISGNHTFFEARIN